MNDSQERLVMFEDFLKQLSPGHTIFGRLKFSLEADWTTSLFIIESPQYYARIPQKPLVEVRAGLLDNLGGAVVVVTLIRVEGLPDTYVSWWNYHAGEVQECFKDMATQSMVPVVVYDADKGPVRVILIKNRFAEWFADAERKIQSLPAWSMEQFDRAQEALFKTYPSAQSLWRTLTQVEPTIN